MERLRVTVVGPEHADDRNVEVREISAGVFNAARMPNIAIGNASTPNE
jgi:hypothetical protein